MTLANDRFVLLNPSIYRTQKDTILPIGPVSTKKETAVFIPKNTTVIIGIKALNCDQEIWGSTVNEWIPERWLSPLPETVSSAGIPGVYSNMYVYPLFGLFVSSWNSYHTREGPLLTLERMLRLTFLAGSRACM